MFSIKNCGISIDTSNFIKGVAVSLMVLYHVGTNGIFYSLFHLGPFFTGASCVAMFALISGYAQALVVNKNANKFGMNVVCNQFASFYKRYLFVFVLLLPVALLMGFSDISSILLTVVPIEPNLYTDSWWYSFCYLFFCFILFPIVRGMERSLPDACFVFAVSVFAVTVFLLPLVFSACKMHDVFTSVWGTVPLLRTIMFVPYYCIGYAYFKSVKNNNIVLIFPLIVVLLIMTILPFELYDIPGISAVDVGLSFIVVLLVSLPVSIIKYVRWLFAELGKVSLYVWLIHMPLYECLYKYISFYRERSYITRVLGIFLLSIFVAFVLSCLYKYFVKLMRRIIPVA